MRLKTNNCLQSNSLVSLRHEFLEGNKMVLPRTYLGQNGQRPSHYVELRALVADFLLA